jgi:acetylornithine aminotransferase
MYLMQRLQELDSPLIKEIRGRGLMVELTVPVKEVREPLLFEERIFTGYSGLYTLRILPPLVLSTKEVDIFVGSLKKVLDGYYENSR